MNRVGFVLDNLGAEMGIRGMVGSVPPITNFDLTLLLSCFTVGHSNKNLKLGEKICQTFKKFIYMYKKRKKNHAVIPLHSNPVITNHLGEGKNSL